MNIVSSSFSLLFTYSLSTSARGCNRPFISVLISFFTFFNPIGSWVMLWFYTPYTIPKLRDLLLIKCHVRVARHCLKAPVKLHLIIHNHPVLSILLVPFCEPFDLSSCSLNILFQFLYNYINTFPSNLVFSLKPFPHSILEWSVSALNDFAYVTFYPGCWLAFWLPLHLALLNFSVTISVRVVSIS